MFVKRCAYCGGNEVSLFVCHKPTRMAFVECKKERCGAQGPTGLTVDHAIHKWNRRPRPKPMTILRIPKEIAKRIPEFVPPDEKEEGFTYGPGWWVPTN